MKSAFLCLAVVGIMVAGFAHYGSNISQPNKLSLLQPKDANSQEGTPPSALPDSGKAVTVLSPLAQLIGDSSPDDKLPENRPAWKPHPSDHVAPSPTGTSGTVLQRTFSLSTSAAFAFQIPPHAATPHLHGSFHCAVPADANPSGDANPEIGFLLLNQDQYSGFRSGHLGDALMSVDSTHDQDVNFGLPASLNQAVKYYLVFHNRPGEAHKVVQANFSVDF